MEFSPVRIVQPPPVDPSDLIEVRIHGLKVSELRKTKSDVIERVLSPIQVGTNMKYPQFKATQDEVVDQLRKLDIFSEVNLLVDIQKTPKRFGEAAHVVDVNVKVDLTEKNWREPITMGLFYNGNENAVYLPTFRAKGNFKNIFGRGEKLYVNTNLNVSNFDLLDAHITFEKPFYFWSKPNQSMSVTLDRAVYDHQESSSFRQRDLSFDIDLNQQGGADSHTLRRWKYTLAHRNIDCSPNASEKILLEGGPHIKSAISHYWEYDSRESSFVPSKGSVVRSCTELAGIGGDVSHLKQTTTLGTSLSLGAGVTLTLGLRTGLHVPLSKRSFISDRFFIGGIDSFRGFERSGIGPRSLSKCENKSIKANSLGGDVFYVGTADLSIPIAELAPMADFRLHLFSQFGNSVQFDDEGFSSSRQQLRSLVALDQTRFVVGAGVLCPLPGGRIELNFNCPLKYQKEDGLKSGLEIGVGVSL